MTKVMLDIKVADLLEQIQAVDKIIELHKSRKDIEIAQLSIKQYGLHRQEFINQLNAIFNKYSLNVNSLEYPKSKKLYKNEALVAEAVSEDILDYKKKR